MWKGWICSGNSCRKGGLKGWKHHSGALAAHCKADWLSLPKPFIHWQAIKPRQVCWSSRVISVLGLCCHNCWYYPPCFKEDIWLKILLILVFLNMNTAFPFMGLLCHFKRIWVSSEAAMHSLTVANFSFCPDVNFSLHICLLQWSSVSLPSSRQLWMTLWRFTMAQRSTRAFLAPFLEHTQVLRHKRISTYMHSCVCVCVWGSYKECTF